MKLTKRGQIVLVEIPCMLACAGLGIFGGLLIIRWAG